MGHGTYTDSAYDSRNLTRSMNYASSTTMHTADIENGRAERRVHQRLNPMGLKKRESRDSEAHPDSLAIAVFFDVTGSMGSIPITLRNKLNNLMGLLLSRGYVADPQVLFGAIGDATCDQAPLQVGQFESDVQMDEDLDHVWVEGGGGGMGCESYELAYYVAARHTSIDCWEKRHKRGYLFTIGDEMPYDYVSKSQVKSLIGGGLQANAPFADVIKEAQERYNVYHLIATKGSNGRDESMRMRWKQLLGDNAILVDHMDFIAETIALIVGMNEGAVDLVKGAAHLKELGVGTSVIAAIESSLAGVAKRAIALSGVTK